MRAHLPIEMNGTSGRGPLDFVDLHSGMGKNVDKSTSTAQLAVTPQHAPIAPASGTGSALFVINLCASIAPVRLDGNNIPGLENYRLYQVARNEDGRTRHRLRLGFFTSEKHAESVLTVVRQQYPTAFTTCLMRRGSAVRARLLAARSCSPAQASRCSIQARRCPAGAGCAEARCCCAGCEASADSRSC